MIARIGVCEGYVRQKRSPRRNPAGVSFKAAGARKKLRLSSKTSSAPRSSGGIAADADAAIAERGLKASVPCLGPFALNLCHDFNRQILVSTSSADAAILRKRVLEQVRKNVDSGADRAT